MILILKQHYIEIPILCDLAHSTVTVCGTTVSNTNHTVTVARITCQLQTKLIITTMLHLENECLERAENTNSMPS